MKNEETKEEKLIQKLRERKLELEVLISSVELSLQRHGYDIPLEERMPVPSRPESGQGSGPGPGPGPVSASGKGPQGGITNKPQPGIRIQNKLSYRGKEKCCELYHRLDEDNDQRLNFLDMRVMRSLSSPLGLVNDPKYLRRSTCSPLLLLFPYLPTLSETWAMAMADQGILTENSFIDIDEFIRYRQMIELQTPLSSDLMSACLGYLPRLQRRWIRVKDFIKNCFSVRSVEEKLDRDEGIVFSSLSLSSSSSSYDLQICWILARSRSF